MNSSNRSIMWDEIIRQPETIAYSLSSNHGQIRKIAQAFKKKDLRSILLAGRGSSDHANQIARYLFESLCKITSSIILPSVYTKYDSISCPPDALVLAVSQSGGAKDLCKVLDSCRGVGASTVAITNREQSPLAQIATQVIYNNCGEEKSITAAKSFMSQVALLALLAAELSEDEEIIEDVLRFPEYISEALCMEDSIKKAVASWACVKEILIFARGILSALALETELKIQETARFNARAYSVSDYYHGPISATKQGAECIFLLGDQNTDDDTLKLLSELKSAYAVSSLVVSPDPQHRLLADSFILTPNVKRRSLSFLVHGALFTQMFSCLFAISRGCNPDRPLGLSKSTSTF